jgi:hypothetical protein
MLMRRRDFITLLGHAADNIGAAACRVWHDEPDRPRRERFRPANGSGQNHRCAGIRYGRQFPFAFSYRSVREGISLRCLSTSSLELRPFIMAENLLRCWGRLTKEERKTITFALRNHPLA